MASPTAAPWFGVLPPLGIPLVATLQGVMLTPTAFGITNGVILNVQ